MKQINATVFCKICRNKFVLINAQTNAVVYICVKCTFPLKNNKNK